MEAAVCEQQLVNDTVMGNGTPGDAGRCGTAPKLALRRSRRPSGATGGQPFLVRLAPRCDGALLVRSRTVRVTMMWHWDSKGYLLAWLLTHPRFQRPSRLPLPSWAWSHLWTSQAKDGRPSQVRVARCFVNAPRHWICSTVRSCSMNWVTSTICY